MVCLLWTKVVRIPCYVGEIYGRPTVSLILLVNYHFATYRSLVGLYISEIKCQLIGLSHLTIYYHHHHCRRRHHQDIWFMLIFKHSWLCQLIKLTLSIDRSRG
jgi:hypothetical protein